MHTHPCIAHAQQATRLPVGWHACHARCAVRETDGTIWRRKSSLSPETNQVDFIPRCASLCVCVFASDSGGAVLGPIFGMSDHWVSNQFHNLFFKPGTAGISTCTKYKEKMGTHLLALGESSERLVSLVMSHMSESKAGDFYCVR